MTTIEEAMQKLWPGVSDELADELLWSLTPYPCSNVDTVIQSMTEYHQRAGGDPQKALDIANEDYQREIDKFVLSQRHGWTSTE